MNYYLIAGWLLGWVLTLWVASKIPYRSSCLYWYAGPIALVCWPVLLPLLALVFAYEAKHGRQ